MEALKQVVDYFALTESNYSSLTTLLIYAKMTASNMKQIIHHLSLFLLVI